MLTNILLGLILGIVLTSFILINNKINIIQDYLGSIVRKLNSINSVVDGINNSNCNLLDRFNNFVLRYNELNGLLETKVNHNTEYFDKRLTNIIDKICKVDENIIAEHSITRNEIKKLAKISSKKKLQSKTNKSINHKQKCE